MQEKWKAIQMEFVRRTNFRRAKCVANRSINWSKELLQQIMNGCKLLWEHRQAAVC